VSEKADRETLSTIENKYYLEDNFDPKGYELEVKTNFICFLLNISHLS
jgi:hypothetical protein